MNAVSPVETLVTDHLDLWTAALKRKSTAGRGSSSKVELYGIKKLRELILELAVRGLLVPQDPNDEPASELLKRIAAEKAKLVEEGKIKKDKPLPAVSDDEKYFLTTGQWEWCRLQEVCEYIQRGKGPAYADAGKVRVISQKCIQWTGFDLSAARFVDDTSLNSYKAERYLKRNDLLWNSTGTGTVGRANVLDEVAENALVADSHVTVVRSLVVDPRYLCVFIWSPGVQARIEPSHEASLVSGSTQQVELNTSSVTVLPVPLPPLSEQHRIVAKVDELMALCDQLEQETDASLGAHQTLVETLLSALTSAADHAQFASAWQRIAGHFDTLFTTEESIAQLKQTILQLAVMGKLVPQDPNDEPASELLKKIAAEKAKLVKEGKAKKERLLPPVGNADAPYRLPQGWAWIRLGQCGVCSTGKTPSTNEPKYYDGDIPFIGPGQISIDGELSAPEKFVSEAGLEESTEAKPNDIFMVCIGGSIGKAAIADKRLAFNQQINAIRPIQISSKYLYVAVSSKHFTDGVIAYATGSATPIINRSKWEELPVPICSIQEQIRIVAKVDELMALCDQLKSRLSDAQTTQLHLADALVERAIG